MDLTSVRSLASGLVVGDARGSVCHCRLPVDSDSVLSPLKDIKRLLSLPIPKVAVGHGR